MADEKTEQTDNKHLMGTSFINNNSKEHETISSHKDSSYSWIVCFAAFLSTFMTTGFSYTIGIYFVVFRDVFKQSSSAASWVSSLNYGTICLTGILSCDIIHISPLIKDTKTNAFDW